MELKRQRHLVTVMLRRITQRLLAGSFLEWQFIVQESARHQRLLERVSARFRNRLLAASFRALADIVYQRRRHRHILGKTVARFRNRALSQVLIPPYHWPLCEFMLSAIRGIVCSDFVFKIKESIFGMF